MCYGLDRRMMTMLPFEILMGQGATAEYIDEYKSDVVD